MITLYVPPLMSSLRLRGAPAAPPGRLLYLSFEDALDALLSAHLPPGSKVAVPEYYCWSVVEHLEAKGYGVVAYPVDECLQAKREKLLELLAHHDPRLVIVFHPLGMESCLRKDASWQERLAPQAIVLEDYAHRIFDLHDASPFKRSVSINSFRKLSAAEGAWMWGDKELLSRIPAPQAGPLWYRMRVKLLFFLWRCALACASFFESELLFALSEKLFEGHEALIGRSTSPYRGDSSAEWCFARLDVSRLRRHRAALAKVYEAAFKEPSGTRSPISLGLCMSPSDAADLKFFPLRTNRETAATVIRLLSTQRIYLDTLYEESPHCKDFVYLMLPLYPTVSLGDAQLITKRLHEAAHS